MLLTERPSSPGPVTTPMVKLRLHGEGHQERIFRLPSGKTTIGSSPRCTLRIDEPGVAPVHCLIVQRGDSLTVRRWASGALLNGLPFDDARLSVGDCLSLGAVELDILSDVPDTSMDAADQKLDRPAGGQNVADEYAVDRPCDDEGDSADHGDMWQAAAAEVVFQRLRLARTLSRERSRKLLAALRRQREAHREVAERAQYLEQQVQSARTEGEDLRRELERVRNELAVAGNQSAALDSVVEEKRTLIAERAQLAEVHSRLGEERTRLAQDNALLAEENARLAQENKRLAEDYARLAQENEGSAEDHARLAEENARLAQENKRLAEDHARLAEENARLAQENKRLAEDHARLAEEKAAVDQRLAVACDERQQAVDAMEHFKEQCGVQQAEFARERAGWDELRQDWQSRLADHVRQIEDLERQLETLREDQPVNPALPEGEGHGPWNDVDASSPPAAQPFVWQAAGHRATSEVPAGPEEASTPLASGPSTGAAAWPSTATGGPEAEAQPTGGVPQTVGAADWQAEETTGSDLRDSDLEAVREFSIWNRGPSEQPRKTDESFSGTPAGGPPRRADDSRGSAAKLASEAPFTQQTPPTQQAAPAAAAFLDESRAAGRESPVAARPEVESSSGRGPSFIERYAHMFEDDVAEIEPVPKAEAPDSGAVASQLPAGAPSAESNTDDNESIEQYMAKLMQRTRGQSSASPPASQFVPPQPAESQSIGTPTDSGTTLSRLDEMKRAGRRLDQSSNLAALRSLANDIARQAIGTYAARKYRRTAMTQIIIATLAALTSLYLMLLSSTWWDVRFLSACVSLAASLYYAFLTITTLIDSVRASVFEELEHDLADDDPWSPPLPIDIERKTS
jgi:hypothetical protein